MLKVLASGRGRETGYSKHWGLPSGQACKGEIGPAHRTSNRGLIYSQRTLKLYLLPYRWKKTEMLDSSPFSPTPKSTYWTTTRALARNPEPRISPTGTASNPASSRTGAQSRWSQRRLRAPWVAGTSQVVCCCQTSKPNATRSSDPPPATAPSGAPTKPGSRRAGGLVSHRWGGAWAQMTGGAFYTGCKNITEGGQGLMLVSME